MGGGKECGQAGEAELLVEGEFGGNSDRLA